MKAWSRAKQTVLISPWAARSSSKL